MGAEARRRQKRRDQRRLAVALEPAIAAARPRAWQRGGILATLCLGVLGALLLVAAGRHPPAQARAGSAPEPAPGPTQVSELEPNDRFELAQDIPLSAAVDGELDSGDADCFSFTITQAGPHVVSAWLEGSPGLRLEALSESGTASAHAETPARIADLGVLPGRVFLVVSGSGGSHRYRLHVSAQGWALGRAWEPDGTAELAQEMTLAEAEPGELARHLAWGTWSSPDDVDCWRIPLRVPAAGATMHLELQPPVAVSAALEVLDSGEPEAHVAPRRLQETIGQPGQPVVIPALGERSWEPGYTVCARIVSGPAGGRYRLEVRQTTPAGPFEFEPNDTPLKASALPRDVEMRAHAAPGDVDWFRLSSGSTAVIQVTASPPAEMSLELALLDRQGRTLAERRGHPGSPVVLEARGIEHVRVRPLVGASVERTYRLIATDARNPGP